MTTGKQLQLMALPAHQLLEQFGAGKHKPGSGSAAALMGILAGKLVVTVGRLTLRKASYQKHHRKIQFIIDRVEKAIEPELRRLFEEDAIVFDEVIKHRVARDEAIDERERRRHGARALERLKDATNIPIRICELCLLLIDHGVSMFDVGFQAARGDSGTAISAAVAGAMASIFVINLNLRSFRSSEWAQSRKRQVLGLHSQLEEKQLVAFGKVSSLQKEDVNDISSTLFDA